LVAHGVLILTLVSKKLEWEGRIFRRKKNKLKTAGSREGTCQRNIAAYFLTSQQALVIFQLDFANGILYWCDQLSSLL